MTRFFTLFLVLLASTAAAASDPAVEPLDLTGHWVGYAAILIFSAAYFLVILEEKIHLRKSRPVLLAVGIIQVLIALAYNANGLTQEVESPFAATSWSMRSCFSSCWWR